MHPMALANFMTDKTVTRTIGTLVISCNSANNTSTFGGFNAIKSLDSLTLQNCNASSWIAGTFGGGAITKMSQLVLTSVSFTTYTVPFFNVTSIDDFSAVNSPLAGLSTFTKLTTCVNTVMLVSTYCSFVPTLRALLLTLTVSILGFFLCAVSKSIPVI
jgi:hypothetical protein